MSDHDLWLRRGGESAASARVPSLFEEAEPSIAAEKTQKPTSAQPARPDLHAHAGKPSSAPGSTKSAGLVPALAGFATSSHLCARVTANFHIVVPVVLTILACVTHLYKLGWNTAVCWDEAHFGKFGAYYIRGTFYHDVHPPLAKMLVGFSGILGGFNGDFEFESGKDYPAHVPFVTMRVFNAAFGIARIPLAYFTARELGFSRYGCLLAGGLSLFDNALTTISRFILLDSILLFFTATSIFAMAKFHNQRHNAFGRYWWKWLLLTGINLGCVMSSKWVGLFAYAVVGLYTVWQLHDMLTERRVDWSRYAAHWLARIVGLILVPVAVYIFCFKVHFALLYKSGPGDSVMNSLFQASLEGSDLRKIPLNAAYGSSVTIRANTGGGGLLHSHKHSYPEGSKQQQITTYGHKDENNNWIIKKPHGVDFDYSANSTVELVRNGDIIRLVHNETRANLHSHDHPAPRTKDHKEVSGYGADENLNDTNDHWRIEIVRDDTDRTTSNIRALTTKFRLVHVNSGCLLRSVGHALPDWGFKQDEVYCENGGDPSSRGNTWNIENHVDARQPMAESTAFRTNFFRDFLELNAAMWSSNNALIPDRDKIDVLSSEPYEWPFMTLGMRMVGWEDHRVKFYLLGNPFVWIASAIVTFAFPAVLLALVVRNQRSLGDWAAPTAVAVQEQAAQLDATAGFSALRGADTEFGQFVFASLVLFAGWFLHYIPFYIMGRVTYLHHYFPAIYFSMLLAAHLADHAARRFQGGRLHARILVALLVAACAVFVFFRHVTFGIPFPAKEMAARRWRSSWNMYD